MDDIAVDEHPLEEVCARILDEIANQVTMGYAWLVDVSVFAYAFQLVLHGCI